MITNHHYINTYSVLIIYRLDIWKSILRITIKLIILPIYFFLTSPNAFNQTINPPPTISIEISKDRAAVYENIEISWICLDPGAPFTYQLQNRYKLDAPADWLSGLKYNITKWAEYKDGNTDHIIYNDFIVEGVYKISVQCRNKMTGIESEVFSKTFTIYWEDPEILEEAFNIDFDRANSAESQKEKYKILAEEYKKAFITWNQKLNYELNLRNATLSTEELFDLIGVSISEAFTQEALVSLLDKSTQNLVKKILLPLNLYEMIKLGVIDILLIYRRYHIDKAFNMAAVSYKAWKLFESLAVNSPTIIFIIDSSGSMTESDPNDIRKNALIEICQTFDLMDHVIVIDFDDNAKWVNPDNFNNINKHILSQQISTIDSDGGTDIGNALTYSYSVLENFVAQGNIAVIMISDGIGDYSNEAGLFANKQIPIYTISLLDRINEQLMNSIAEVTNAEYFKAYTEFDIIDAYFTILNRLMPVDIILSSVEYNSSDRPIITQDFYIEPGMKKLIVTLFSSSRLNFFNVTDPSGQKRAISNPGMFFNNIFESISVDSPLPGKWVINYSCEPNLDQPSRSKVLVSGLPEFESPEYTLSLDTNKQIKIKQPKNQAGSQFKLSEEKIQVSTPEGRIIEITSDRNGLYTIPTFVDGSYKIDINLSGIFKEEFPFQRFHTYTFYVDGVNPFERPVLTDSYGNIIIVDSKSSMVEVGDKCYLYSKRFDKEMVIGTGHVINKTEKKCTIELIEFTGNLNLTEQCWIVFISGL